MTTIFVSLFGFYSVPLISNKYIHNARAVCTSLRSLRFDSLRWMLVYYNRVFICNALVFLVCVCVKDSSARFIWCCLCVFLLVLGCVLR